MADDALHIENEVLALAYAPGKSGRVGEPLGGKVALQKVLYHLRRSLPHHIPSADMPHFYGPFDEQVEFAAEQLESSGYLEIEEVGRIALTERGMKEAKEVWERELPLREKEALQRLKEFFSDLSVDEILAITYAQYPESATDSLVADRIQRIGKRLAIGLVQRGKISVDLGAKISGMGLKDFLLELSRRNIPVVERDSQ